MARNQGWPQGTEGALSSITEGDNSTNTCISLENELTTGLADTLISACETLSREPSELSHYS